MKMLKCLPTSILIAGLVVSFASFAQTGKSPIAEEEGKSNLVKYAATYNNRASWEQRAERIKANILNGLQLDPLPTRHALKPIIAGNKQ